MFEASLVTRLLPVSSSVYPLVAPKNYATPCVVYNRSDTIPTGDLGRGTSNATLFMQIDCYDLTYLGAKTLADLVRKDLEQWVDTEVQAVSWTGETDMVDNTTEVSLYRTKLTFQVYVNLN